MQLARPTTQLVMDSAYGTNSTGMDLLAALAEVDGTGVPFAYCLTEVVKPDGPDVEGKKKKVRAEPGASSAVLCRFLERLRDDFEFKQRQFQQPAASELHADGYDRRRRRTVEDGAPLSRTATASGSLQDPDRTPSGRLRSFTSHAPATFKLGGKLVWEFTTIFWAGLSGNASRTLTSYINPPHYQPLQNRRDRPPLDVLHHLRTNQFYLSDFSLAPGAANRA